MELLSSEARTWEESCSSPPHGSPERWCSVPVPHRGCVGVDRGSPPYSLSPQNSTSSFFISAKGISLLFDFAFLFIDYYFIIFTYFIFTETEKISECVLAASASFVNCLFI